MAVLVDYNGWSKGVGGGTCQTQGAEANAGLIHEAHLNGPRAAAEPWLVSAGVAAMRRGHDAGGDAPHARVGHLERWVGQKGRLPKEGGDGGLERQRRVLVVLLHHLGDGEEVDDRATAHGVELHEQARAPVDGRSSVWWRWRFHREEG